MKSAFVLAKVGDLYDLLVTHLGSLKYPHGDSPGSIRLQPSGEFSFTLYDRPKEPSFFERFEIPKSARERGYRFGYLVECRSEKYFCEIIRSIPSSIDLLICDSNGNLFRPDQIDPNSIAL